MGVKLQLLRGASEDVIRAMQLVQVALDQIPEADIGEAVSINRTQNIADTTEVAFVDASGGPIVLTLPTVGTRTVTLRSVSNSTNPVTVQTASGAKINGTSARLTLVPLGTLQLRYNPATKGWFSL